MNSAAACVSDGVSAPKARILPNKISGIQLLTTADAPGRVGIITQLPQSAQLEVCGEGFDDRTVKVRWLNSFYFVFRQDLEILAS